MTDPRLTLLQGVRDYYSSKLAEHGPHPSGVDWSSVERQRERFRQLTCNIGEGPNSVLDLGCGYGALWDYLVGEGKVVRYLGLDISGPMIAQARTLHADLPDCVFEVGSQPRPGYEHVVASGIFNVRAGVDRATWEAHVQDTMRVMFEACEKTCAFNFLTSYSDADRMSPALYYADPRKVLDFCITRLSLDEIGRAHV